MSTAGHTPNFIAEEDILPFRCVKVGSVPFKAVPSTSDPEVLLGVTDGSVQGFQSAYHAKVGQPISLQNGEFVQLTAGGTIAVGDTLIATTDGKVIADTAGTEYIAQAVDNATDGEVFWAKKIGAWTVGGGGGGGTMTINVQEFDDPEAANVWTKPAGAVSVMVQLCGAGQDGGMESVSAAYGGNGGTIAQKEFDATDLPSTVSVTLGLHQPFATASEDGTSAFGTYVYAPMAAYSGPTGADAGGSNLQVCGSGSNGQFRFGQGANEDLGLSKGSNQGFAFGPGAGGGSEWFANSGAGGKASTNNSGEWNGARTVATSGGGAAGLSDGIGPGGNGGDGSIDPVTGFGGGGGAGGYGGPLEDGGDGGNGIRGGGGGAAGRAGEGGNEGFPGQGGDGYVRVTTICFN